MGNCGCSGSKTADSEGSISKTELQSIFKSFDSDGDGMLSQVELHRSLRRLGLNPTSLEVNAMFSAADINRDGKITFEEFRTLIDQSPALTSLQRAFQQFDIDGDGVITEKELRQVIKELGQEITDAEVTAMFKAADVNTDRKITFDEFANLMKRQPLVLNLREVFRQFDVDNDGYICESELRVVCRQLSIPATDREVSIMFQAADGNGDGKISFEEFSTLLTQRNR